MVVLNFVGVPFVTYNRMTDFIKAKLSEYDITYFVFPKRKNLIVLAMSPTYKATDLGVMERFLRNRRHIDRFLIECSLNPNDFATDIFLINY